MDKYVINHDFGYGTSEENHFDSTIKKLELRNKKDLAIYLKDLIINQMNDTNIDNNVIKIAGYPEIKLIIKDKK